MKKLFFSLILCLGTTFLHAQGLVAPGGTVGDSGNGNVGIGTTNTGNGKLTVNGSGTQLRLENDVLGEEARMRLRAKNIEGKMIHADIGLYATGKVQQLGFLGFKVPHNNTPGVGYTMVINHSGNVGIGTETPGSALTIRKTAESNRGHLQFGNQRAESGEVSSIMSLAGWGIQHAGFSWVPNSDKSKGKLHLSFGGSDNSYLNPKKVTFQSNGHVGIGTLNPDAPLTVAGNIHAREVKVTATAGGADFVFADDYALPRLEEVNAFIKANKHLPEIPSAAEMEKNGLHLAEMNIKLLQKVEELTLYLIEKEAQLKKMEQRLQAIEEAIAGQQD